MIAKYTINFLLIFLIFNIACEKGTEKRKIKLSTESISTGANRQLTTTIHLEEKERRSIAVMFFENLTGDKSLQWLQKGLTEMLIRALSQSRSLSVLTTDRLFEILDRLGEQKIDVEMAAIVAKEANVEAILTGNITKNGDSLRINVTLREPNQGMILKEESVEGPGLEHIFGMVDQLSQRIKNDLHLTLEKAESEKGIAELSTNSLDAWRHYTTGVDLSNKLFSAEAVTEFEKAIELDSNFVAAYIKLFRTSLHAGDIQKGLTAFQKAQTKKDRATQKEFFEIKFYEAGMSNDFNKMNEVIQQWVEQFPDDRDANYNIADFQFKLKNYDQAIKYYEKVLVIDPQFKLAFNQLGYSYAFTGDFEKGIATLQKYRELAPDEPNPYDSIGELYYILGDYQRAEKYLKQALQVNDNFHASWRNLGLMSLEKGDFSKAMKMYQIFLEKASTDLIKAEAYSDLARTYWRFGKRDQAIVNYQKAFESSPYFISNVRHISEIYLEQNDSTKAQAVLVQSYEQIKNHLKTDSLKSELITNLFLLSLWYDIRVDETIDIMTEEINSAEGSTSQLRLKFLLTLIYIKKNQKEKIDQLWQGLTHIEFIEVLKAVHNIGYNNLWEHYALINRHFYQSIADGVQYYDEMIRLSQENDSKISEMIFRLFLSDIYFHAGNRVKAEAELKLVGAPAENSWLVIGPFDNTDGFQKQFPPEKEVKLSKIYRDNQQKIVWQRHADRIRDGFIDLKADFNQSNWSVAYGLIYLVSPDDKRVQLRLGTNESVKIWLNQKEIWRFNRERDAIFDDDKINVQLKAGMNQILIKVCNRLGNWGFYFRVTDETGNGASDIEFVAADAGIS